LIPAGILPGDNTVSISPYGEISMEGKTVKKYTAVLTREASDKEGMFGKFVLSDSNGSKLSLESLELMWKNNQSKVSCIPPGNYTCKYTPTNKEIRGQKNWYLLSDTSPRTGILIHIGNYAGDTSQGIRADSNGCILLGKDRGELTPEETGKPQRAVLASTTACAELAAFTGREEFSLTIV
jgi:hypothetical protein